MVSPSDEHRLGQVSYSRARGQRSSGRALPVGGRGGCVSASGVPLPRDSSPRCSVAVVMRVRDVMQPPRFLGVLRVSSSFWLGPVSAGLITCRSERASADAESVARRRGLVRRARGPSDEHRWWGNAGGGARIAGLRKSKRTKKQDGTTAESQRTKKKTLEKNAKKTPEENG